MLMAPLFMVFALVSSTPRLLQSPHPWLSPADTFRQLAEYCDESSSSNHHRMDTFDVYGDFNDPDTFLRHFEQELAQELDKEDAVFMPSGVMAQSIALLIHSSSKEEKPRRFACHSSCHLLVHEKDAYRELLGMEAISLETLSDGKSISPLPLDFATVQLQLKKNKPVSTLILEVPHRELGGKVTTWRDVELMRDFCRATNIAFHCDGARLFEASAAFPDKSLADLAEPFDSVYVSFYKGLAGLSGAMLFGSREFCTEARVWLRRMGGNLYTVLPYAVSAHAGYQNYWLGKNGALSFPQKKEKLRRVIKLLREHPIVSQVVRFDPEDPQVNMVHGYLFDPVEDCQVALERAASDVGMKALHRIRSVHVNPFKVGNQYKAMFEWNMGEANAQVEDEDFVLAWESFAKHLLDSRQGQ